MFALARLYRQAKLSFKVRALHIIHSCPVHAMHLASSKPDVDDTMILGGRFAHGRVKDEDRKL